MTLITSTANVGGLLPPEYASLVLGPVESEAIATNEAVSTVVRISAEEWHAPVINEDAAANWLTEGQEIDPTNPTFREMIVKPAKVGGICIVSRELAEDSSPSAATVVGESIARSVIRKIDAAFFGALAAPAPGGLASLTGVTEVDTGGAIANLDPFAEAVSEVEAIGGQITAFAVNPTDALTIAKIKAATGSNLPLLGTDPAMPGGRQILGRPLFSTPAVEAGTVWAIDRSSVFVVIREDVKIALSGDAFFTSDRVAIRATMRIGYGFTNPARVVKLSEA